VDRSDWHHIGERARDAAIEWHVRLASGVVTDAAYEAFAEWLSRHPDHAHAYLAVESFSGRLDALRRTESSALNHLIVRGGSDRGSARPIWRALAPNAPFAAAIAATLLIVVGVGVFALSDQRTEHAAYAADLDAFRKFALADGTTVDLGPGAIIETAFEGGERRITSFHGIGYFDVAHDKSRPFTIAFGSREIRVVGTQFEVSSFDDMRSVAVAEGVVAVRDAGAEGEARFEEVRLTSGEQLLIDQATPDGSVKKVPLSEIGAWREGYFTFDDADIDAVVRRLNAFYGAPVFAASDEELTDMSFSGILKLSDPQGTARRLSELFPIDAVATENGFVLKTKRQAG
jgi:transmembrane sensor